MFAGRVKCAVDLAMIYLFVCKQYRLGTYNYKRSAHLLGWLYCTVLPYLPYV